MAFLFIFLLSLLPGQSHMAYREYNLDKLCPSERANSYVDSVNYNKGITTIVIYDTPSISSVLVEHVWDNSSYQHLHHCEFNVRTHSKWLDGSNSGLYVAIRELNFRQNIMGECIDYVIIEVNTQTAPTSHKICGTVYGDESMLDEKNYFEIPEGFLKMIVHIGPHNLEPNEIIMKLTFTAFEDCNGSYKLRCTNKRCISGSLYNDLIINCIPPFCADEPAFVSKCGMKPTYFPSNTEFLVVGSTFVLVIFGVAMAWYFLKIYVNCSQIFGDSRVVTEHIARNPVVEYQTVYVPPATDNTLDDARTHTDDPPSYDSLFRKPSIS